MSDEDDRDEELQFIETRRLIRELYRRHEAVVYAAMKERDGEGTYLISHAQYGCPPNVVFLAAKLRSVVEEAAFKEDESGDELE